MRRIVQVLTVGILLGSFGCTQKVEMKPIQKFENMQPSEIEKLKGYLEAAGIKGNIVTSRDAGDNEWVVLVGQLIEPGKKVLPVPPKQYLVNKQTGQVSPQEG
jgi:hypothetical protein